MRFIRNPCPPRPGRAFPTRPDRRARASPRVTHTSRRVHGAWRSPPPSMRSSSACAATEFAIGHRRARQGRGLGAQHPEHAAAVIQRKRHGAHALPATVARHAGGHRPQRAFHRRGQVRRRTSAINTRASRQTLRSQARPVRVAARRHHDMDVQPALASGRGSGVVRGRSAPVPGAARRYDCGNFCSHRPPGLSACMASVSPSDDGHRRRRPRRSDGAVGRGQNQADSSCPARRSRPQPAVRAAVHAPQLRDNQILHTLLILRHPSQGFPLAFRRQRIPHGRHHAIPRFGIQGL